MKKISVLGLFTFFGLATFAQDQPMLRTQMEKKTRFGIDAGVNLATFNVNEGNINTNSKTSFHAGAFVNIPVGGMFSIQPEAMWSGQGSKYRENNDNFEEDLHYINIPVLVKLQTMGGFFLETGPQVGFLIKGEKESGSTSMDIKDMRKTTDVGWAGGLGYQSRSGLGIHGRYVFGFSNVLNADDDTQQMDGEWKNKVVQIGLSYTFGAGK